MTWVRRNSGFTLIEVLVVVFIIGIVLTFAALSLHDRTRSDGAEQEGGRLATLLGLSREEAVLQAREFALQLTARGYEFLVLDGEEWKPLKDDELLRPRQLAPDVTLSAIIEGEKLAEEGRIYVLSSGEMTAFTLDLRDAKSHYRLDGEPGGALVLSEQAVP